MKKRKDWNTFFAIEKNLAYEPSMQTTKELAGLRLNVAAAKHSASLSFGALIRKQLAFTFWKIWFFQGLVLAALCAAFFCLYHETLLNQIASPLPEFLCLSSGIVVLSAIPILRRSSRYRMMELEQSTRFSILGSLAAQLIFIGIGDLAMLSVLAFIVWQHGLTSSVIFIYLIVPFLTAATSCLMLWIRSAPSAFEQRAVLLCAAATLLIWQVIKWYKDYRPDGGLWFWYLYAFFCLGILHREYRKLQLVSYTEKML